MWRRKAWIYSMLLFISLLFLMVDHRGLNFGDHIFRWFGLPAWSRGDQGLHYSVVLGLILTLLCGNLVIRHFRKKYNKVARKVVVACILLFILFPLVTKWALMLVHVNDTGLAVLDYSKKDYRCSYTTNEGIVSYRCTIQLFNYGKEKVVVNIKPILERVYERTSDYPAIEIQYRQVTLEPRSGATYSMTFESKPTEQASFGSNRNGGVSFLLDGQEKHVQW